ncbi:MAG TPA: hypothetical protein EYP56_01850 [Planctomycetaceae bacterium]|nr:hypothetical protein [Planctomycetaceae bacterium]HIQ22877.1 hypothetical protein [Planctomycetota bacterium]
MSENPFKPTDPPSPHDESGSGIGFRSRRQFSRWIDRELRKLEARWSHVGRRRLSLKRLRRGRRKPK